MNSPNMAKRVLLALVGAAAGAAAVTSTVSSGVPRPILTGSSTDSGSTGTDVASGTDSASIIDSIGGGSSGDGSSGNSSSSAHPGGNSGSSSSHTTTPSSPKPTPTPSRTESGVSGTFTGDSAQDGPWGSITVTVTVKNNRVVDCAMRADVYDRQSQFINNQMSDWNSGLTVPEALKRQALESQSAQISGVSGATYTSYAYSESLASALRQAGL